MTTRRTIAVVSTGLALGLALGACGSGGSGGDPTPGATATVTVTAEPTPTATTEPPTETPTTEPTDALPPGFPDPATLIGQEVHTEPAADGTMATFVGTQQLDVVTTFGACFDGGTGDICAYAISGLLPSGDSPQPADVGMLLLERATGTLPDGSVTWQVVEAIVVHAPDGPAYLETCEGAPGVAIFADPDVAPAPTLTVEAAWGPDAAIAHLVPVAPESLTCEAIGD